MCQVLGQQVILFLQKRPHYGRTVKHNIRILWTIKDSAKNPNRFEIHKQKCKNKHRKRILIWGFFYFPKVVFVPKHIRKVEIKTFVLCYLNNAVYERVGLFCLSIQLPKINIIMLIVCYIAIATVFLTYNCEGKKDLR